MSKAIQQRLNLNLEELFPGDTLTICDSVITIKPLGLRQLADIARKLKGIGSVLSEEGVDFDNYNQPENLLKLAVCLLEHSPSVLEEASNIALEDLQELPIELIVSILDKVIEVNMKSKEALEGNFSRLAGRLNMTPETASTKSKKK